MCSGPAGESWGHLLPLRRRETGEAEGVGLCGHSKGPRSSFNSRAAKPHSSIQALLWRGLREQEGENGENEETHVLSILERCSMGGGEHCNDGKHRVH